MNKSLIIDTSVLLAMVKKEGDYELLYDLFPHSIMSSVNIAEVSSILRSRHNLSKISVNEIVDQLVDTIMPFSYKQAMLVGEIELMGKEQNCSLSLGDKACIALGIDTRLPIYTADKIWANLKMENLDIKLIR